VKSTTVLLRRKDRQCFCCINEDAKSSILPATKLPRRRLIDRLYVPVLRQLFESSDLHQLQNVEKVARMSAVFDRTVTKFAWLQTQPGDAGSCKSKGYGWGMVGRVEPL
jgi:hypothetical protein